MSNQPTVCCVMLTRDRPELAAKAVECWKSQTYNPMGCRLLIYDTGIKPLGLDAEALGLKCRFSDGHTGVMYQRGQIVGTIGQHRNAANEYASQPHAGFKAHDILIHFDDDDWSHPNRIAEQVAFLQISGADVVGYNQMLFWRSMTRCPELHGIPCCDSGMRSGGRAHDRECSSQQTINYGEAWLYTAAAGLTPALGTSLCYWRKTWERQPFNPALPKAGGGMSEETEFLRGLKCASISSLAQVRATAPLVDVGEPRMIARIHGANFGKYDIENQIARGSNAKPGEGWERVPKWDRRVREILA